MNIFRRSSNPNPLPEGSANSKRRPTRSSGGASNGGVTSSDGKSTVYRVAIPPGTTPGSEFQVHAGSKIVRVCCPPNSKPGQLLQISVPLDPSPKAGFEQNEHRPMGPPDSPNAQRQEDGAYMVTIPNGVRSGQQFPVTLAGQTLMVTSPINARPGTQVRVMPPRPPMPSPHASSPSSSSSAHRTPPSSRTTPNRSANYSQSSNRSSDSSTARDNDEPTQLFEVLVPKVRQTICATRGWSTGIGNVSIQCDIGATDTI
jgi:hypothetical protein